MDLIGKIIYYLRLYLPVLALFLLVIFFPYQSDVFPDAGLAWILMVVYALVYLYSSKASNAILLIVRGSVDVIILSVMLIVIGVTGAAILINISLLPLATFLLSMVIWVGYSIFTSDKTKKDLKTESGTGGILFMITVTLLGILYMIISHILFISQATSNEKKYTPYIILGSCLLGALVNISSLNKIDWKVTKSKSKLVLPHLVIITIVIFVYAIITHQGP